VRNAWYRSEVTDGTIELELNFVHMRETKETVLTGREEAALDSYSTVRAASHRHYFPSDVKTLPACDVSKKNTISHVILSKGERMG
jgi:hypothetical protein